MFTRNIIGSLMGVFICIGIGYLWIDVQSSKVFGTYAKHHDMIGNQRVITVASRKEHSSDEHHLTLNSSSISDETSQGHLKKENTAASWKSYKYKPSQWSHLTENPAMEVVATGYSPDFESTGKTPDHPAYGITYSGLQAVRDKTTISTIAADLAVFPLGTVLFIPGYGYGVVADIGSAIKGGKIDLYFNSKDQVYREWGKRKLHVYVLQRGQGKISPNLWEQIKSDVIAR